MPKSLETLVVGDFEVNCYLYWDDATHKGVIIDPGADEQFVLSSIVKAGFGPQAILLTHGHSDHIGAVGNLKNHFHIPVVAGHGEEGMLKNPSLNLSSFVGSPVALPEPERLVGDEELLDIFGLRFTVLATPGHTPGGVCYFDETDGILFCGDTLFQGSIGRTDLPGGSTDTLLESIQTKILALPDSILCYPGHGPRTTVGVERRSNPFLTGGNFA